MTSSSATPKVKPLYQKKVGLLAKQHGLGMPWVSSWAAGGRDGGGITLVGTGRGGGYAT